jgi:hypothetical protein
MTDLSLISEVSDRDADSKGGMSNDIATAKSKK